MPVRTVTCPLCGLQYLPGWPEDEKWHRGQCPGVAAPAPAEAPEAPTVEFSHAPEASPRPPQDPPPASAAHVESAALLAWAAAHGWPRLQLTLAEAVGAGRAAWEAFVAYVAMPQGVALAERNRRRLLEAVLAAVGQEVAGGVGNRSAAA